MYALRQELLDPGHDLIEALPYFKIREDERQITPHSPAVPIHHGQICTDMGRKIDLAPHVGADLSVMDRDSRRMRSDLPFIFTNLKIGQGLDQVVAWVEQLLPQRVHRP